MWKPIKHTSASERSSIGSTMRYFIFYPPSKTIRSLDVDENISVGETLELVKKEFGLQIDYKGPAETDLVLNYNGCDLKAKWLLSEIAIPSGAILRCLYREQTAAQLYVHCNFNKQIIRLNDPNIDEDTSIRTLRKQISNKLGLPLSLFCLETFDEKQRLYDEMTLLHYDIHVHDHIRLKIWGEMEKFVNSCLKGFPEHYAHDDLTRHYQAQVALYMAAFYGHIELANSALIHGGRTDQPVGEHPSRQWSSSLAHEDFSEVLKCPIHVAIERGHVKMVALFVRSPMLCTQVLDPVTGYLPYRLALSHAFKATNKEEKQRYHEIYFYLHDKQYNLKIPLNASGEYVTRLLNSMGNRHLVHRAPLNYFSVSLPVYCRIIRWYERARARVWKKYGSCYSTVPSKRVYAQQGLLGYKVLIDGFNNTFSAPANQGRGIRSASNGQSNQPFHYGNFTERERRKFQQMKIIMKQTVLEERRRAQIPQLAQRASITQAQNVPTTQAQRKRPMESKPAVSSHVGTSSSSELSQSLNLSTISEEPMRECKTRFDLNVSISQEMNPSGLNASSLSILQSTGTQNKWKTLKTKLFNPAQKLVTNPVPPQEPVSSLSNILTKTNSTVVNKLPMVTNPTGQGFYPSMSIVDAYFVTTARPSLASESFQLKTDTEPNSSSQTFEQTMNPPMNNSQSLDPQTLLDMESHLHLPERTRPFGASPIKSSLDLRIHQSTIKTYEHRSGTTARAAAINCIQEAKFFKRKSWLKQIEISKEMIKQQTQRHIRQPRLNANDQSSRIPLRATMNSFVPESKTVSVQ